MPLIGLEIILVHGQIYLSLLVVSLNCYMNGFPSLCYIPSITPVPPTHTDSVIPLLSAIMVCLKLYMHVYIARAGTHAHAQINNYFGRLYGYIMVRIATTWYFLTYILGVKAN